MYIIKLNNGQWILGKNLIIKDNSNPLGYISYMDMFRRVRYKSLMYIENIFIITPIN